MLLLGRVCDKFEDESFLLVSSSILSTTASLHSCPEEEDTKLEDERDPSSFGALTSWGKKQVV
jgi:hypothetical protein